MMSGIRRQLSTMVVFATLLAGAPGGSAAQEPSCEAWEALKPNDRLVVIGSALEQQVGRPESSRLAACLWSIYEQIADHTTEICARDGGAFGQAARIALDSAIDFCKTK
jgi:hypothetical protein